MILAQFENRNRINMLEINKYYIEKYFSVQVFFAILFTSILSRKWGNPKLPHFTPGQGVYKKVSQNYVYIFAAVKYNSVDNEARLLFYCVYLKFSRNICCDVSHRKLIAIINNNIVNINKFNVYLFLNYFFSEMSTKKVYKNLKTQKAITTR